MSHLAKYGRIVVDNGYEVIPIVRGSKAPGLSHPSKNWQKIETGPHKVQEWVDRGYGNNGVGVRAKRTPGVDIDCQDVTVTSAMYNFVVDRLGETIERVGLAPKTLLVYRAESPFPKVNSNRYLDSKGRPAKLEVLGDGQQFVALAIHPDTGQPYRWKDKKGVHNTPVADLPEITHEDALAIRDEFERLVSERGWAKVQSISRAGSGQRIDRDNPFITDARKVDISEEDLRAKLMLVPGSEDYETWFQIGMSLYHQFDGSTDGLGLWHEWSQDAPNYDARALDAKWDTFAIEGKGRQPVTARLILKLAGKEAERVIAEELDKHLEGIMAAPRLPDLIVACNAIKKIAFDRPTREMIAARVRERYKTITNANVPISTARAMIRFEEQRARPFWLEDFVYIQHDERFYNTRTRQNLSTRGFDQSFGRYMLTKQDILEGKSSPEHAPSHMALNVFQIPTVANKMYMPGEDDIFSVNGQTFANTYSDISVPKLPEKYTAEGRAAIETVEKHLEHLFASVKARKHILDYMAYIVQTLQRVNHALIIQGAESDGKTFILSLLGVMLGAENVSTIRGKSLEEKYTAWAEGSLVCLVEEVRLHGNNRFDALNNIKPFLTNPVIPIRRMNTDEYRVINRTSYILTTNHRNGMPAGDQDTRYYPAFSRWQTREALLKFKAANPDYYPRLFKALEQGAQLRKWFLERVISKEFNEFERAPESDYRREMVELNRDDESEALIDALKASTRPDFCEELLDSALVADSTVGLGAVAPYGRRLKQMLSENGFTYLDRVNINGEARRFWSRRPELFMNESMKVNNDRIRAFLTEL